MRNRIELMRLNRNMDIYDLAAKIGISAKTLYDYETDEIPTENITLGLAVKIARALDCSFSNLFDDNPYGYFIKMTKEEANSYIASHFAPADGEDYECTIDGTKIAKRLANEYSDFHEHLSYVYPQSEENFDFSFGLEDE